MYLSKLKIENFRQYGDGEESLTIEFQRGVTALIGRNDSGKSTVVDAIRFSLLTRCHEYLRVQPEDFHVRADGSQATDISIRCELSDLTLEEQGTFAEHLTLADGKVSLIVTWSAKRLSELPGNRRWVDVTVRSGIGGTGLAFESSVRDLLAATYLRPLRDAEREMSPGRGSRLSQILANVPEISSGEPFTEEKAVSTIEELTNLSLVGIADYLRSSIRKHASITSTQNSINNEYLSSLSLSQDSIKGRIDITEGGNDAARLRQILERLELRLFGTGNSQLGVRYGLGSNNLLYMACELLLLGKEPQGLPLLLIEEPEAHLHPQRQLRLMEFLTEAASKDSSDGTRNVQTILTTHSPNLASKILLENIVILDKGKSYSLAPEKTKLRKGDYRFLQRFLDVTKANLFFAHAVLIVEGDAEAILIPSLASAIGFDLTEHGVSIVNVGGTGLKRYSHIFQRKDDDSTPLQIPVACLADMDVMPDCAPQILGLVTSDSDPAWTNTKRKWRASKDFSKAQLDQRLTDLREEDSSWVKTFVADNWTFEYDLAFAGMAEEVFLAAYLANKDSASDSEKSTCDEIVSDAKTEFQRLQSSNPQKEALCTEIYKLFHSRRASKAIAAQYLAEQISEMVKTTAFDKVMFRQRVPAYIVAAIEHVCGNSQSNGKTSGDAK